MEASKHIYRESEGLRKFNNALKLSLGCTKVFSCFALCSEVLGVVLVVRGGSECSGKPTAVS